MPLSCFEPYLINDYATVIRSQDPHSMAQALRQTYLGNSEQSETQSGHRQCYIMEVALT